jgi:hypothetical protein
MLNVEKTRIDKVLGNDKLMPSSRPWARARATTST